VIAPNWPTRQIFPTSDPCPPATTMPWRLASARRTASPSTPSGTEIAVTSEHEGSSGENSSRPISRTRPRTIAPSSSVRAQEALTRFHIHDVLHPDRIFRSVEQAIHTLGPRARSGKPRTKS